MILEGNEGLKAYAQNNVLSNEETCDKLKVSKQYLYRLINEEKLTPFKQMKGGYLFWKPDVLAFDQERKIKAGYGSSTHKAIEDFEKLDLNPDQIDSIHIYRYDRDAAIDDFYEVCGGDEKNQLMYIEAPTFIIKMVDSTEYWISGLLCGYCGTSTGGTEKVLYKLRILDSYNTRESEAYVAASHIIHIYRTDSGWETIRKESYWDKLCEKERGIFGLSSNLYSYNGNLVLVVERYGINYSDKYEMLPSDFIETCFEFIDDATMVENLTKEKALETGHFVTLGRLTNIFQIILSNDQKRELWMIYPNDEKYEAENQTMLDILKQLGLELTEEKFSSSFWKKLKDIPRSITRK